MNKAPKPFKWILFFFRWFCHPDYQEDIEGDLLESFDRTYNTIGRRKAQWRFFWEVVRLIRPGIIRPLNENHPINQLTLIKHNLLITLRVFNRYKAHFAINVMGLSMGLACTIVIYLWVHDELSVDKFHTYDSQLYQVMTHSQKANETVSHEYTPGLLAKMLAEEMPEVLYADAVIPSDFYENKGIASNEEIHVKATEQYVGNAFFKMFSYQLIAGNQENALQDKYAVVITDRLALKLFNTTENLVGKTLEWKRERFRIDTTKSFIISGIVKSPPSNSTAQFDLLLNYELFLETHPDLHNWGNSNPHTYVMLQKAANVDQFNQKIAHIVKEKNEGSQASLFVRPYSNRYLYGSYKNGKQIGGRIVYVRLFSLIAVLILSIACINFINLTTAKSSRRGKEVGIKKTLGASRSILIFQFFGESILISCFSVVLALVLVAAILPWFNELASKQLHLEFSMSFILVLGTITLLTGILSGSYPALFLSALKPVSILKGRLKTAISELVARKGLVVFQFAISILLIVSVIVIYKQIEFVQNKHLGYDRDHIITFKRDGNLFLNMAPFLSRIEQLPSVVSASSIGGNLMGNHDSASGLEWEGKDQKNDFRFKGLRVNYEWIETLGIEMKEGRAFSKEFGQERGKIIFNETAIKQMGITNPIGKFIKLWGDQREIIGVVKDFHLESLHEEVKPCFLRLNQYGENVIIKMRAGQEKETLVQVKAIYEEFNPGLGFEFSFLDTAYQTLYESEQRVSSLSFLFAVLAIFISCLGLFGLAAFTAERRTKEIGIRKILGASSWGITRLLSGEFIQIVLLAIAIALPISYWVAQNWLEGFAFKIELEWWYFIGVGLLVLCIAWLTIGIQTFKAATINPVKCLRDE